MTQHDSDSNWPLANPEGEGTYSLEVVAQITGVDRTTLLHYREHGLLRPAESDSGDYDDESLRRLRRIEELRRSYEMNLNGVKLMLNLLDELEDLRNTAREFRHRP